jgi:hypothetical protein
MCEDKEVKKAKRSVDAEKPETDAERMEIKKGYMGSRKTSGE